MLAEHDANDAMDDLDTFDGVEDPELQAQWLATLEQARELIAELKAAGVYVAEVAYDGKHLQSVWGSATILNSDQETIVVNNSTKMTFMDFAKALVEVRHPCWTVDEGSFGLISLDVSGRILQIQHNRRYLNIDESEEQLPL